MRVSLESSGAILASNRRNGRRDGFDCRAVLHLIPPRPRSAGMDRPDTHQLGPHLETVSASGDTLARSSSACRGLRSRGFAAS
jgi:hypothetical protein